MLDYYVPRECRHGGTCIVGDSVVSYNEIWDELHPMVFEERVVRCQDIFMRANDLAWPAKSLRVYNRNMARNKLQMMLVISAETKRIVGVAVCATRDIDIGEECGNVYGYEFWCPA